MKPVVSPAWFYLINLSDRLGQFFLALLIGAAILAVILGVCIFVTFVDEGVPCDDDQEYKAIIKLFKRSCFVCIAASVLFCVTPTKESCYEMLAATVATPDNISAVGKTSKDIVNYIVDAVNEVTKDDEDKDK